SKYITNAPPQVFYLQSTFLEPHPVTRSAGSNGVWQKAHFMAEYPLTFAGRAPPSRSGVERKSRSGKSAHLRIRAFGKKLPNDVKNSQKCCGNTSGCTPDR